MRGVLAGLVLLATVGCDAPLTDAETAYLEDIRSEGPGFALQDDDSLLEQGYYTCDELRSGTVGIMDLPYRDEERWGIPSTYTLTVLLAAFELCPEVADTAPLTFP